jgi:hypothetical protein
MQENITLASKCKIPEVTIITDSFSLFGLASYIHSFIHSFIHSLFNSINPIWQGLGYRISPY